MEKKSGRPSDGPESTRRKSKIKAPPRAGAGATLPATPTSLLAEIARRKRPQGEGP